MTKTEIQKMTEEESQLQAYLEAMEQLDIQADDNRGYIYEAPVNPFVRIGQKDIKDGDGNTLVKSGAFRFSAMVNPPTEVKELEGIIVSLTKTRTYFKTSGDASPTCQSRDGISGSEKRDTVKINNVSGEIYGSCNNCVLRSSFTPGFECKEGRTFAFIDKEHGPIILSFSKSGINKWRQFYTFLQSLKKKTLPLHIFKIKITLEFMTKPFEYYRPEFKLIDIVTPEEFAEFQEIRTKMFEGF